MLVAGSTQSKWKIPKKVLTFFSCVWQLAADLKAMNALVTDQEVAIATLSGLQRRFKHLTVALDPVVVDRTLSPEFRKSRFIQEEE